MPIAITCSCGKSYQAPDNVAGRRVKCPACGGAIAVPGGAASDPLGVAPSASPFAAAGASPFASAGATSSYGTTAAYGQPQAYGGYGGGYPAQQPAYSQPAYGQAAYGQPQYGQQASGGMSSGLKIGLAIGGVVAALAVVGVIGTALLLPAVQAARNAARKVAAKNAAAQGGGEMTAAPSASSGGGGLLSGLGGKSSLNWRSYTSTADGYSVEFPGETVEKTQSQPTPLGIIEVKLLQARMPDGSVFQVASNSIPSSAGGSSSVAALGRTMLENGIEGMVERLPGGRVVTSRSVDKGQYPGREAVLTMDAGSTKGEGQFRMYLSATHVYQIGWLGPSGAKPQADVDRFLNSLTISSPPPDAAPAGGSNPGMPPLAQPGGIPGGFPGGPPGFGNTPDQGVAGGATPPGGLPAAFPGGFPGAARPGFPGGANPAMPGGNDPFAPVTPGAAGNAANPPGFPTLPGGPNIPGAPNIPGGPNFPNRPNFPNFPGGPGAGPGGPGGRNFGPRNVPRPNR